MDVSHAMVDGGVGTAVATERAPRRRTPMHHPGTDWASSLLPDGLTAPLVQRKWTSAQRAALRRAIDSARAFRDRAQRETEETFITLMGGTANNARATDHMAQGGDPRLAGVNSHNRASQEALHLERAILQRGMIRCDLRLPQTQPSVSLTNLLKAHRIPTPYIERITNEVTPGGGEGFMRILEDILDEGARHGAFADTTQQDGCDRRVVSALQLSDRQQGSHAPSSHGAIVDRWGTADDEDAMVFSDADVSALLGSEWHPDPGDDVPCAHAHQNLPTPALSPIPKARTVVNPTQSNSSQRHVGGGPPRDLLHYQQQPATPTRNGGPVSPTRRLSRVGAEDNDYDVGDPNAEYSILGASVDGGFGGWASQVQGASGRAVHHSSTGDPGGVAPPQSWDQRHDQRIDALAKRKPRDVSPEAASLPRQRAMLARMSRLIEDGKRQLEPERLLEKAWRVEHESLSSMRQSGHHHHHHHVAKSVDPSELAAAEELVSMMDNKKRLLRRLQAQHLLEPLSPRAAVLAHQPSVVGGYVALSQDERSRCDHAWRDNPTYLWLDEERIRQQAEEARARRERLGTSGKAPLSRAPPSRYASFAYKPDDTAPLSNTLRSSGQFRSGTFPSTVDDDACTLDWTVSGPVLRSDAEQQFVAIQRMKEQQHQSYEAIASEARRQLSPIDGRRCTASPFSGGGGVGSPPQHHPLRARHRSTTDLVVVDVAPQQHEAPGTSTERRCHHQLSDRLQKLSAPRQRSPANRSVSTVKAHAQTLRQQQEALRRESEATRHITIPIFMNIAPFA